MPEQISADGGNAMSRPAYILTPPMGRALRDALDEWRIWLAYQKRFSPHTLAAYQRDINGFLIFLTEHIGGPPGLADLEVLKHADFRSYLVHCAAKDNQRSSIARSMSTLRNFFRWLERRDLVQILHGLSVDQLAGDELTPEIYIAGQDQELQSFFLSID